MVNLILNILRKMIYPMVSHHDSFIEYLEVYGRFLNFRKRTNPNFSRSKNPEITKKNL